MAACAMLVRAIAAVGEQSLSRRRRWSIYKRTALTQGSGSKRDVVLSQAAFYRDARGVLKVLDHMIMDGD
jgi:hypothetical protein